MAKLSPTDRNNHCSICDDTSGDCREADNGLALCHTYLSEIDHPDYVFRKIAKDGLWGVFAPRTSDWSEARKAKWDEKQARRKEHYEKQQQQALRDKLTRPELDKAIRKISAYLGLASSDREALEKRGLSPSEIEAGLFFSVGKNQSIPSHIPASFPGKGFGDTLTTADNGIACIAFNREGLAIGIQVRYETKSNKYRWLKNSHLKNGELPLTYVKPKSITRTALGVTEGILKPSIASEILEQEMIGASGGNFSGSPQQLGEYLEGHEVVNVYPDAGDVINSQVTKRWKREIEFFQRQGLKVLVGWWGQIEKSAKDIDELTKDELGKIEYIEPEEFFNIADFEQYQAKVMQEQKKLNSLSYPVNLPLNCKYLPNLVGLVPLSGLLNLKCRKGGGKSWQINRILAECKSQGKRIISITPRIALGRSQSMEWDINWIDDGGSIQTVKIQGEWVEVDEKGFWEYTNSLGLCWDSLWKLIGRDWSNTVIVIDEAELGFSHISSSSTCRDRRPQIFKLFEKMIPECLANGGLVILSDADLSDISVDYVLAFADKDTPVFTVVNEHKGDPWEIDLYSGKADEVEKQIFDSLELNENIVIATDNQKEAEALERRMIKVFPELAKSIIRIDRKATAEDWGKDFVNRPNESMLKERPRVLIYTPSMGTGVSLDFDKDWENPYFSRVFGLFFGQLEPSQCRQMLIRYRRPVPRTVWVKERGNLSGNVSFLPEQIKKRMFSHHEGTAQIIDLALSMAKEQAEDPDDDQSILPALIGQLEGMMKDDGWNNPHIDLYAKIQARRNFGLSQLAVQLRQELIEEGHNIAWEEVVQEGNSTGDEIKEEKELVREETATKHSQADNITAEEANKIKYKGTRTEEEDHKLTKFIYSEMLPGVNLTPQFFLKFVEEDNGRLLKAHRFFWDIIHPEEAKEKDRSHWKHQLKRFSEGVPCMQDIRTYSGQVDTFRQSGLFDLIDLANPEKELHAESEEVQEFMKRCNSKSIKHKLRTHCNIVLTQATKAMKLIGDMAKRCGLKLKCQRTEKTEDGGKIRYYALDVEALLDADRLEILKALDLKLEQYREKQEQERIEKEEARAERQKQKAIEKAAIEAYRQKLQQEQEQAEAQATNNDEWEFLPLNEYQLGQQVLKYSLPLQDEVKGIPGKWLKAEVIEVNEANGYVMVRYLEANKGVCNESACFEVDRICISKQQKIMEVAS